MLCISFKLVLTWTKLPRNLWKSLLKIHTFLFGVQKTAKPAEVYNFGPKCLRVGSCCSKSFRLESFSIWLHLKKNGEKKPLTRRQKMAEKEAENLAKKLQQYLYTICVTKHVSICITNVQRWRTHFYSLSILRLYLDNTGKIGLDFPLAPN